MTFGVTSVWTPETTAIFERLHADRMSYGSIALELQKLGFNITRNACIGKAKRMKMSNGRIPGNEHGSMRPRPAKQQPVCEPVEPPPTPTETRTGLLIDLDNDQCRWPVTGGNTGYPPFLFCTNDKTDNSSYCAAHHARGVQPVRQQR